MTNNEINRLIKKWNNIIAQNEATIRDCKRQVTELQGLKAKAVATRLDIERAEGRRMSALERQFPTGSNINFEGSYKEVMKNLVGGDQYNTMINELKAFEGRITTKINRLNSAKGTCSSNIQTARGKIRYLESQREN